MNIMDRAISWIKFNIPPEVIQRGFVAKERSYQGLNRGVINVDAIIRERVFYQRLLIDIDTVGGTEQLISLDGLPKSFIQDPETWMVVSIPPEMLGGRIITQLDAVVFLPPGNYPGYWNGMGFVPQTVTSYRNVAATTIAASSLLAAYDTIAWIQTTRTRLLTENTIAYTDFQGHSYPGFAKVRLSNPRTLSNIPIAASPAFNDLALLAAKAYLYNTQIVDIDEGELRVGFNVGAYKEIISNYSSAAEDYQKMLTTRWARIAMMSDDARMERHVKSQVSSSTT